ncbi:unnamed protein product, partial [Strongylus vulgaris]
MSLKLVFRGTFYPPTDVIALTDIIYSSALCDAQNSRDRKKRLTPHLIGIRDWDRYRQSGTYKGETMIIVSEDIDSNETMKTIEIDGTSTSTMANTRKTIEETDETLSSSTIMPSTNVTEANLTSAKNSQEKEFLTVASTTSATDVVANFMNLLKQAAPVLPYIPVLMKTLQSVDLHNPSETDFGTGQPLQLPVFDGLAATQE